MGYNLRASRHTTPHCRFQQKGGRQVQASRDDHHNRAREQSYQKKAQKKLLKESTDELEKKSIPTFGEWIATEEKTGIIKMPDIHFLVDEKTFTLPQRTMCVQRYEAKNEDKRSVLCSIDNFFTNEECDSLIQEMNRKRDTMKPSDDLRNNFTMMVDRGQTSQKMDLTRNESFIVTKCRAMVAAIIGHVETASIKEYTKKNSSKEGIPIHSDHNWTTGLAYLNTLTAKEKGCTVFPGMVNAVFSPKKGQMLIFRNFLQDSHPVDTFGHYYFYRGNITDPNILHMGEGVLADRKIIAQFLANTEELPSSILLKPCALASMMAHYY